MADQARHTVTISVCSLADSKERLASAFRGEAQGDYIEFATLELMWKILSVKRWEILEAMTGQGELSIDAIARKLGRDIEAVEADIHALIDAGIVEKSAPETVVFPYDEIHVDFKLRAA